MIFWATMKRNESTGFGYTCELCGYKLDWKIGDPWPAVKVQPNLIAAGAKRLAQQNAQMQCKACGNTILEGQSHCAFCGASRK
jgi:predicted RNA-binding Zn-ribbon protein involved in translation (DUF1610 family)